MENQIGDENAKSISDSLMTNKTQTEIDLNFIRIGKEAGMSFPEILKKKQTLTRIGLKNNQIGDQINCQLSQDKHK